MEYLDVNNKHIMPGSYWETFYKGDDVFRNGIIEIIELTEDNKRGLFSVMNKEDIVRLNPNYSKWLISFKDEAQDAEIVLFKHRLSEDISFNHEDIKRD